MNFKKNFSTFESISSCSLKMAILLYSNFNFAVNLVTPFSRQKPLKSKNKNHMIVSNIKFYHTANFELKRIKTATVIPRVPFHAFRWPGV